MQFNSAHLIKSAGNAAIATVLTSALLLATYFVVEPTVGRAVDSTFTIRQEIIGEISFLVPAANVTMVADGPGLNGLTGGNATGTTQVAVRTNGANGYNMVLDFEDENGDGVAMEGEASDSGAIQNYRATTTEPTFGFFFGDPGAVFAYTVTASSSDLVDLDQSFKNNGSACNAGSNTAENICWMTPTTTASFMVVNRDNSAPTGATTTIRFRVFVPNAPTPTVDTGFYTATATLTAVNNP